MDAGGLAQMSYNNNYTSNGGLAAPGSGFASRGKGGHIKHLSVGMPSGMNIVTDGQIDANPTLRTSRAHLLAGLRTANRLPASAPYNQPQHSLGLDASKYADQNALRFGQTVPQTATGASFTGLSHNQYNHYAAQQQMYSPEHILAPPALYVGEQDAAHMDPNQYAQLVATNVYLAQRQQQLQQQLMNVTAAAQQLQGLNLSGQQQRYPATPITPQMSFYNQQAQSGLQPVIQEVPGQPGLLSVYNPMTGQRSYVMHPDIQQEQTRHLPDTPPSLPTSHSVSPSQSGHQTWRPQPSPPVQARSTPTGVGSRSLSPPKDSSSAPADVEPLPPPSANAFRRGHKKTVSSLTLNNATDTFEGSNTGEARCFPKTPMTGAFGPGQARAGEHPTRQPRGPPQLDELTAAPTAKHEGSKNFAARQRRRALHSLVRAGNERRSVLTGSAGTPGSESEINFTNGSENDSDSVSSGSAHGAVGNEWNGRQGGFGARVSSGSSISSDAGNRAEHALPAKAF